MKIREKNSKIILFTCNWNAYSGLEAAGAEKIPYSPTVYPIRLACLGRITPGIILKAFENGANTYKRLKKMNPDIRVLLSSGMERDGNVEEILNDGQNGFIRKPFKFEDFTDSIDAMLS